MQEGPSNINIARAFLYEQQRRTKINNNPDRGHPKNGCCCHRLGSSDACNCFMDDRANSDKQEQFRS